MDPIQVGVQSSPFSKTHAVNSTASSFASKVPTITEPTGDGVIKMASFEGVVEKQLLIIPYGTASDNHTFDMRIIGWRKVQSPVTEALSLWVPVLIAQLACVHGGIVGIALSPVVAAERFCDTLAITAGSSTDIHVFSPAGVGATADLIGYAVVDNTLGFQKIEITFDLGSGTDLNTLIAKL